MTLERKQVALEIKALDDTTRTVTGYANVKNVVDLGGDIVVDGAYVELDSLVKDGWGCVSHNWGDLAVGMIMDAKEDDHGLLFTMQFHSTEDGTDTYTVIKERFAAGKTVSFSIGYFTMDATYETRDGEDVRVLKSIKVVEVSHVNMAMNPDSIATGVKARPLETHFEAVVTCLDDLVTRFADINGMRKQGLKSLNLGRLEALQSKIAELLAGRANEEPEKVSDDDLLAFMKSVEPLGVRLDAPTGTQN